MYKITQYVCFCPSLVASRVVIMANVVHSEQKDYSLVVTHLTTNLLIPCLHRAERTGGLVLNVLRSYELTRKKSNNVLTIFASLL